MLTFGGLATGCATAIVANAPYSVYSMTALALSIGVIALLSAFIARDKPGVVGFSPLDLLMRFRPNPYWPNLVGLVAAGIAIIGAIGVIKV